ncbi:kinesin family protein-like protein [Venturia nashicola]|uniref:Kinesin family protein-like protein n=1 Tax=Venturia nashicola TaxID=86259 RepID=A0A4Z1PHT8_9PEZI|nr:kinesin family protein-like protein [Venturia nashicola]
MSFTAVRVRPPLTAADPGFELVPHRFRGSTCQVTSSSSMTVESAQGQGKKLFVFDRVFGPEEDQEGIYDYLKEGVNSFVEGYNVSILAYGQSGAGKSYTMGTTGPAEQNDAQIMGVVPRAAATLFEKLTGFSRSGIRSPARYPMSHSVGAQSKPQENHWQLKATYVEIYQEQLRDLLVDETIPLNDRPQIAIREDTKGRILLTGLNQIPINSIEDLLNALNFGSAIRQTDATAVNARSSRSHAVFSLNLVQKKPGNPLPTPTKEKRRSVPMEVMSGSMGGMDNWITVDSKLHFVDLAGSERMKNTGAQGERAKEGISINAGLASLGKVISQLSSRQAGSHVSYRDSRLTRLLQDSLGGNAITYMVACVNPAEFHLSETLNTVQYAQRARAIQSKPQIQTIHDDSDKQAVIERLRAEVSFLRDQIRLSERSDRKAGAPQERSERLHERDVELQNQLLDIQENYNALSQRHAKLIGHISKVKASDAEDASDELHGDTANERQERAKSSAGAIESMILEYEKTIQTLESSLSNTRGSLSNSESTLLEKETKIAYLETVQNQLQSRLQKAMDREANDENYLHDLESRVAGATTGEEKSNALVQGLRKELSRARENESSCEEYISTLEERLAEAEQDHEMMQREIDRLEHVVERQRSINKLDNLLYELDHIRQTDSKTGNDLQVNGHGKKDSESTFHSFSGSDQQNISEPEVSDTRSTSMPTNSATEALDSITENDGKEDEMTTTMPKTISVDRHLHAQDMDEPTSPAQSKFVADKLDTVTQELFDLRMEHESTITGYDELQAKYQLALKALAEMQEANEVNQRNARETELSRPSSFLEDAGMDTLDQDGQPSSSRTLSSELSSLGESPNGMEASDAGSVTTRGFESDPSVAGVPSPHQLAQMEKLKDLSAEKEAKMAELNKSYAELREQHQDTLDYVEELKAEVQKAQMSGRASPNPSIIRRKSSQPMSSSGDRANRSFASLRNIGLENFEDDPDKLQSFEINLNAAMTELHTRTEHVAALEAEIASLRREMEQKMTIINGLTRERSSLKAAKPIDMSALASMHDQLKESENQMKIMSDAHAAKERELVQQIDSLKTSYRNSMIVEGMPGGFPETPAPNASRELTGDVTPIAGDQQRKVVELQQEVATWRNKHDSAMESMKASEKHLLATISDLETSLRNASRSVSPEGAEQQERKYESLVANLQKEVNEHKSNATSNANRLVDLEQSYNKIVSQVDKESKSRELTEKELETHRGLVANLETQLEEHRSLVLTHQQGVKSMQDAHVREIEQLNVGHSAENTKLSATLMEHKEATASLQKQLQETQVAHQAATTALQDEVNKVKSSMTELIETCGMLFNKPTNSENITSHIQTIVNAKKDIGALHETATNELQNVRQELEASNARAAELEGKVRELKLISDETIKELELVSEKEMKSSRLVEELEDQLNSNYDQTQVVNNRLSALQTERHMELEQTIGQLQDAQQKITTLETQIADYQRNVKRSSLSPGDAELQRSNSGKHNGLRKSVSAASLPSPPPAIPLPPLPAGGMGSAGQGPSPPSSRHQSKDLANAQILEDQEARIRTIEKHLFAEKQLTATLEEALTDLESSSTKMKTDMEGWRRKCVGLEEELTLLRKERQSSRHSVQQLEEERNRAKRLEAQRAELEQRMNQIQKKKKKSSINCF